MKRSILAISILVATSAFGADWFTVQVPLEFQGIHSSISHVGVRCELKGDAIMRSDGVALMSPTFASKGWLFVPLTQATAGSKTSVALGTMPGGFVQSPATVVFTDADFAMNTPPLNDPTKVQFALCYFALRGTDGAIYQPALIRPGDRAPDGADFLQPRLDAWQPPLLNPDAAYPVRWQTSVYFCSDGTSRPRPCS